MVLIGAVPWPEPSRWAVPTPGVKPAASINTAWHFCMTDLLGTSTRTGKQDIQWKKPDTEGHTGHEQPRSRSSGGRKLVGS